MYGTTGPVPGRIVTRGTDQKDNTPASASIVSLNGDGRIKER